MTGIPVLLWMLTFFLPPANAAVLSSGIHGMTWGAHAGSYPRLEKVREAGDVSYYADREMAYHAVGQPVSAVIYGFFRDQLFAAYIKMSYPNQAYYLEKHFSTEYGPAKVTVVDSSAQTIYRWGDEKVKIKLKVNEAGEDIKLGIYYQPLSTELNQVQAEDGPSDEIGPSLSNDKTDKSIPLF
jgi:hypothetical protein